MEAIGGLTVGEFMARVSSEELTYWIAYNELQIEDRKKQQAEQASQAARQQAKGHIR